jgi:DNA-directed RNA polymerase specialized sigma24 family protein
VAIAAETAEIARAAMRRLPAPYRQVLVWTQQQHLTLDEIATQRGCSRDAARKLVGRALARLATEFEQLNGGSLGT